MFALLTSCRYKRPRGEFLARNPFPRPYTLGFYFREKMRAIHQIAPDQPFRDILEVGGGQGGVTNLLYPDAQTVNLDFEPKYANSPVNQRPNVRFVPGRAEELPFENESFDAVTMFDLLEHVPDHRSAAHEALRVLRPGGYVMVSSPNEYWRFPYHGFMAKYCHEAKVIAEWGHVRRGYCIRDLEELFELPCLRYLTFINSITSISHDVAWSTLSERRRRVLCTALGPLTWFGYLVHRQHGVGTETATLWQKPATAATA